MSVYLFDRYINDPTVLANLDFVESQEDNLCLASSYDVLSKVNVNHIDANVIAQFCNEYLYGDLLRDGTTSVETDEDPLIANCGAAIFAMLVASYHGINVSHEDIERSEIHEVITNSVDEDPRLFLITAERLGKVLTPDHPLAALLRGAVTHAAACISEEDCQELPVEAAVATARMAADCVPHLGLVRRLFAAAKTYTDFFAACDAAVACPASVAELDQVSDLIKDVVGRIGEGKSIVALYTYSVITGTLPPPSPTYSKTINDLIPAGTLAAAPARLSMRVLATLVRNAGLTPADLPEPVFAPLVTPGAAVADHATWAPPTDHTTLVRGVVLHAFDYKSTVLSADLNQKLNTQSTMHPDDGAKFWAQEMQGATVFALLSDVGSNSRFKYLTSVLERCASNAVKTSIAACIVELVGGMLVASVDATEKACHQRVDYLENYISILTTIKKIPELKTVLDKCHCRDLIARFQSGGFHPLSYLMVVNAALSTGNKTATLQSMLDDTNTRNCVLFCLAMTFCNIKLRLALDSAKLTNLLPQNGEATTLNRWRRRTNSALEIVDRVLTKASFTTMIREVIPSIDVDVIDVIINTDIKNSAPVYPPIDGFVRAALRVRLLAGNVPWDKLVAAAVVGLPAPCAACPVNDDATALALAKEGYRLPLVTLNAGNVRSGNFGPAGEVHDQLAAWAAAPAADGIGIDTSSLGETGRRVAASPAVVMAEKLTPASVYALGVHACNHDHQLEAVVDDILPAKYLCWAPPHTRDARQQFSIHLLTTLALALTATPAPAPALARAAVTRPFITLARRSPYHAELFAGVLAQACKLLPADAETFCTRVSILDPTGAPLLAPTVAWTLGLYHPATQILFAAAPKAVKPVTETFGDIVYSTRPVVDPRLARLVSAVAELAEAVKTGNEATAGKLVQKLQEVEPQMAGYALGLACVSVGRTYQTGAPKRNDFSVGRLVRRIANGNEADVWRGVAAVLCVDDKRSLALICDLTKDEHDTVCACIRTLRGVTDSAVFNCLK